MIVLTIFNSRRLAVCNCNCEHYRTKFYFGMWCQNKVIIIIIIIIIIGWVAFNMTAIILIIAACAVQFNDFLVQRMRVTSRLSLKSKWKRYFTVHRKFRPSFLYFACI